MCVLGEQLEVGAWEGGMPGFPQAEAESQAAIWLPLARAGGEGLGGAGLWPAGGPGKAVRLRVGMTQAP